ncbi:restriction endonuclease subunit S [Mycobacterium sp.]|uniref:restriction endonuclease subunit S n=1 Tax=Mycobacterium sp. TaxID=1785 RepID=UPI003BA9EF92
MEVRLGDQLDFRNGSCAPARKATGRFPVYGANGPIGYTGEHNARGPLIVVGRVGSYCGSVHYCDSDIWATENALVCLAKNRQETQYWYYALQTCKLNEHRAGTGQPLLNQGILRDISVQTVSGPDRLRVAQLLGAFDEKIAANRRVIAAAEALMVATVESISDEVPLSCLADRSTVSLNPADFDDVVAHFSLPAFDEGAQPQIVDAGLVKSGKFLLSEPCVLFSKLNPRVPRIWNVMALPVEMAVASTEFVVLTPKFGDTSALWSAVRHRDVTDALQQKVAGTSGSHQRIRPAELLDVRVPDVRGLSTGTTQAITALGGQCQARRTECRWLSAYRRLLLPLVVSGELAV